MCAIICTVNNCVSSLAQIFNSGYSLIYAVRCPLQTSRISMGPIITLKEKCRKCYSCVRSCPVKAIKVGKSYTEIIFDRCIGCGNCLSNCPQKAKIVTDKIAVTERLLASGQPVIAVLGCSFPAFFHNVAPGQLVAGLKRLGFAEVH